MRKRKRNSMFFDAMAFALLLAQAAPTSTPPVCPPALAEVAGTENATALKAASGQLVAVVLTSNPGTGYAWQLSAEPDSSVAVSLGRAVAPGGGGATQPPVGAPGREVWLFAVRGPGSTAFTFSYARPWEHVPAKIAHFSLQASGVIGPCMRRFRSDAGR